MQAGQPAASPGLAAASTPRRRPGEGRGAGRAAAAPALLGAGAGLQGDQGLPGAERLAGPSRGFWRGSLHRLARNRFAVVALIGLALMTLLSFCAPLIAHVLGVERDAMELTNQYQPPTARHWFGTDEFGRDFFVRVLYGGQISILMGLGVAAIILAIAIPVGVLAGYFGGFADDVFNWVVQILVTTPTLFVLILVATWIPPSPLSLALIIGSVAWTGNARQARGLALQLKQTDYVLAARALGSADSRIMFRHIMPNMMSLMLVLAGFDVVTGILVEVGLSYLGLGIRPPIPSWGNMLTNSLQYVFRAPHLVIFPGLAIGLVVLCVYTVADGLRDAFDPQLHG
jgi:ABC-type dipeptide/oligopeptide/nickel transport system permease subunit